MLPSVKPDLVIFDYHLTLINSNRALSDERAQFFADALEFVNDLRVADIRAALVSLGTEAKPVFDKLDPLEAWDLFAYHRFPLPLAGIDLDEEKQPAFRDIIQDVTTKLGREPVVWFIGDKGRDFSHFRHPSHFNVASAKICEGFFALGGNPAQRFFIENFTRARQELAAILRPESPAPSVGLG